MPLSEDEVYAVVGEEGFARLAAAFYKQIPGDPILGPMYPQHDLAGAEERLRDFLVFRFGGPGRYIENRGHPRLRMRHAPFPISQAARDRWVAIMNRALEESAIQEPASGILRAFFEQVATFLINRASDQVS